MVRLKATTRFSGVLALLLTLLPLPGGAGTAEQDASAALDEQTSLEKVGEARLKVLLWSVYDSRLYTETGNYQPGQRPLRLEIEYLIDVKAKQLAARTLKEWQDMGRQHPRQEAWIAQLETLWPDIRSGDVVALKLTEDNRAVFFHNGRRLGEVEDPDFGQQFVDIWLSKDSTRPELRLSLLGGKQG
jgi:hypothetical protein